MRNVTMMRKAFKVAILAVLCCAAAWSVWRLTSVGTDGPPIRSPNQEGETAAGPETPSAAAMPGAEPEGGVGQNGSPAKPVVVAPAPVARWESVEDFSRDLAVFETVFWEPLDTVSLRRLIRKTSLVKGKTVLEIGTGTGLLALGCLEAEAAQVVATDVNPAAIGNAAYNAQILGFTGRLDLRLVPLDDAGAYSVIGESEKFDLIISNPPWEDAKPTTIDKYAYYDPGFGLLRSLLRDLKAHLRPGGKALLAYGSVDGIRTLRQLAGQYQLEVRALDDRELDGLPDVFLPGMLLELVPRPRVKEKAALAP